MFSVTSRIATTDQPFIEQSRLCDLPFVGVLCCSLHNTQLVQLYCR